MIKKMRTFAARIKQSRVWLWKRITAYDFSLTERKVQAVLFVLAFTILLFGFTDGIAAQNGGGTKYNDAKIVNAVNAVLTYLEGSFGALVMAAAGIGAILSASFGQYKASLSLMVVAIGSFILRSIMSTFLNDEGIQR